MLSQSMEKQHQTPFDERRRSSHLKAPPPNIPLVQRFFALVLHSGFFIGVCSFLRVIFYIPKLPSFFSAPQIRCVEGRRYRSIVHFYLIPIAPRIPSLIFLFIAPRREVLALLAVVCVFPFKGGKAKGPGKDGTVWIPGFLPPQSA